MRFLCFGVSLLLLGTCTTAEPSEQPPPPRSRTVEEDGHALWLRYSRVADDQLLAKYAEQLRTSVVAKGSSQSMRLAQQELERGLEGLLGHAPGRAAKIESDGAILLGTPEHSAEVAALDLTETLGDEGFAIRSARVRGHRTIVVAANRDIGVLYGVFALLRLVQTHQTIDDLSIASSPQIQRRLLNHWDNLDRSVERGYAGASLWKWDELPAVRSPRYTDYARACASIGINGVVLNNVNADAQILTAEYLEKVQTIADVLRPYGIAVHLTARFSAPIEIGGLTTADPLAPDVQTWWRSKVDEIYARIPDFGGFLVKANAEAQPGPQDYGRNHADGANMLADALAAHGGIVMWRTFVYDSSAGVDRARKAYDEFHPLDGKFRDNVVLQAKYGPIDFQPREPFHPLFGAMPDTALALELQITKEYLGQDTSLAYLGPLYQEVLRTDTRADGAGSTIARTIRAIAGVSNVGSDLNWTGSHFNQANWYVFGRLAWDPELSARDIAEEWTRQTFGNDPALVEALATMMMASHQTVVNYMTPLGLVHVMAAGDHYGPGPWDDLGSPDVSPVSFHRADAAGLGYDRTASGSDAVSQYAPEVGRIFADRETIPDDFLLFFHHVGWNERLRSGRTLWHELVDRYSAGVSEAREQRTTWESVRKQIDARRYAEVADFLSIQADEARWWRDASLQYFRTFSGMPIPPEYEQPAHPLEFYRALACPKDGAKPRCPGIYGSDP
ncbi:MAG TPA: alpha-glucuronidase family glycosyl hydrolase [Polyangiales bacterium]|nr:alpha-glucuronidase family glycosyl hydrolase [Polyangiales bacterium]